MLNSKFDIIVLFLRCSISFIIHPYIDHRKNARFQINSFVTTLCDRINLYKKVEYSYLFKICKNTSVLYVRSLVYGSRSLVKPTSTSVSRHVVKRSMFEPTTFGQLVKLTRLDQDSLNSFKPILCSQNKPF